MAEFFFGKLAGVCGLADNSGALVDFSRRLLEHRADLGQFGGIRVDISVNFVRIGFKRRLFFAF